MMIYEKGRFNFGGASFRLPDGVAIETESFDVMLNGFLMYALDESFEVRIFCSNSDMNAHECLSRFFSEESGYTQTGDIKPVTHGGLNGYVCKYEDKKTLNEEYAYDVKNAEENTTLCVRIVIYKDADTYDEAYKNKVLSEILNGIQCE